MQKLKINVTIDITNAEQMQAAQMFLAAFSGTSAPVAQQQQPKEEKPKRTRRTKAQIEADKAAKEAAASTPPKEEKENTEEQSGSYTIGQVRTALSEKVNDHRAAIKEKLKELGATKVSTMKEEDYAPFMEFLKGLK